MNGVERRIRRIWFAWKDQEEERWLAEQSRQGWHLEGLGCTSYTFRKGEPQPYVYRYDFRPGIKDLDEYLGLFRDAGWDYVGETFAWYCFRSLPGKALSTDIFTDRESRIAKYGRLAAFLAFILLIQFLGLNSTLTRIATDSGRTPFMTGVVAVQAVVIALLGYAIVRILSRISRIKRGTDSTLDATPQA